jgi:hypothetical protein
MAPRGQPTGRTRGVEAAQTRWVGLNMNALNIIIYLNNLFLGFYSFVKNRVL